MSIAFDYSSTYCQSDELRYGPRGSQSYYPPDSGSYYFPEAVSLSPSDSPPPILPAKSNLRRSIDRLDPCAHQTGKRMSEYSNNSSQFNDSSSAAFEFQRNRACKSYAGNEYDFLPGRESDDEHEYDFPPPPRNRIAGRSGTTSGQPLPPEFSANRASSSSYPGIHWQNAWTYACAQVDKYVCIKEETNKK